MLRGAATPGGHPLIRLAWIAAVALLVIGAVLGVMSAGRSALIVGGVAALLLVAGYVAYLVRHLMFLRVVDAAEADLASGQHERARAALGTLLARYPAVPAVQRAAGLATYALGDPLAAASLLERAARSYRDDPQVTATLVASYAALNRGGDARRASALAPLAVDVRLALIWSELVALGGDRGRGAASLADLTDRADVRASASRRAMTAALGAVAAAHRGDAPAVRSALDRAAAESDELLAYERAFIGYLAGVAWRELGSAEEARRAFDDAMAAAPGTIGEALARRERANMLARLEAGAQPSSSSQSPTSSSSSANSSGS